MVIVLAITAVGAAAMGGVFFAFSFFIMAALARLTPAQGIIAMQSINVMAVTPVFMIALFGTAVACLVLAIDALIYWQGAASAPQLAGALIYLVGVIVVTIAGNVPLNDSLARLDLQSDEAPRIWLRYVRTWTAWNHVRTVAGLVGGGLLILACIELVPSSRM